MRLPGSTPFAERALRMAVTSCWMSWKRVTASASQAFSGLGSGQRATISGGSQPPSGAKAPEEPVGRLSGFPVLVLGEQPVRLADQAAGPGADPVVGQGEGRLLLGLGGGPPHPAQDHPAGRPPL